MNPSDDEDLQDHAVAGRADAIARRPGAHRVSNDEARRTNFRAIMLPTQSDAAQTTGPHDDSVEIIDHLPGCCEQVLLEKLDRGGRLVAGLTWQEVKRAAAETHNSYLLGLEAGELFSNLEDVSKLMDLPFVPVGSELANVKSNGGELMGSRGLMGFGGVLRQNCGKVPEGSRFNSSRIKAKWVRLRPNRSSLKTTRRSILPARISCISRSNSGREASAPEIRSTYRTSADNPVGRLQLGVLMAVAEFERGIIKERVNAGLAAAKARGSSLGRPPTIEARAADVLKLKGEGLGVRAIARELKMTPSSVHKVLRSHFPNETT